MKKINKKYLISLILITLTVLFSSCSTIKNTEKNLEKKLPSNYTEDQKNNMENTAEEFINYFGNGELEELTLKIPLTKPMKDFFLSKNAKTLKKKIINGEFLGVIDSNFIIKFNAPCVHIKVQGSKGPTEYYLYFLESGEISGFRLASSTNHYENINSFITLFVAFIIIVLFYFMPILSRKELFFGIRVPAEKADDKELAGVYSLYKKLFLIIIAPITLILIGISFLKILFIPMYITLFAVMIMICGVYLICHKKTQYIKNKNQWNINKKQFVYVDTEYVSSKRKKVAISPLWYLIPILIITISSILIWINYDSIPNSIAIHWNIYGEADNWITKTPTSVMTAPIIQLFVTILVLFAHMTICWSKQQIDTSDPETSMKKDRIFRRRVSIFLFVIVLYSTFIISLFNLISLNIFNLNKTLTAVISISFFIVIVCSGIYIAFFTGQGGSRLNLNSEKPNTSQSRNDDKFWKLGVFYVNKNDPSIFVEKRFGIGYTVNFGNPLGIGVLIIIILLILIPSFIL
ncbi:DUF1648 domain-containing protein [Oceanirhabdus sp. W0125-5]|uniref:DUF1648 domain-containing protein n=1 Tax=Oceanirhabdus sp. W0125-5 TaxID=2999116 RepID=UPI0022F3303C|nr:DUF5808 domain-containing protein [Oceanirhabdus sp. W0125-5]WBW94710.1 DUF5808 domain-containing protein [Oceanirhabdus sp. W0125-5]